MHAFCCNMFRRQVVHAWGNCNTCAQFGPVKGCFFMPKRWVSSWWLEILLAAYALSYFCACELRLANIKNMIQSCGFSYTSSKTELGPSEVRKLIFFNILIITSCFGRTKKNKKKKIQTKSEIPIWEYKFWIQTKRPIEKTTCIHSDRTGPSYGHFLNILDHFSRLF